MKTIFKTNRYIIVLKDNELFELRMFTYAFSKNFYINNKDLHITDYFTNKLNIFLDRTFEETEL